MVFVELLVLAGVALYLLYRWATNTYSTFDERGVYYEKPVPLVGNLFGIMANRDSFMNYIINFYRRNKAHKVCGVFNLRDPKFVVNDPESVKKITVKDFEYFPNHHPFTNVDHDPLLASMLMIMKDQRWKNMRNTLSPIFTASKMRAMFPLMNECFDESLKYLSQRSQKGGSNGFDIELKECFTRLSNDVIASTAFGLKVNSYEDPKNDFYSIGQNVTNFRGAVMFKFLLLNVMPNIMNFLGYKLFEEKQTNYFTRLVVDTMKQREASKMVRPDMIQLLLEAKKESAHNWSDEDIVAQCFIFFFAAFENNANVICTTCHELLNNPTVQQRLYEEVIEMRDELNGGTLTYDSVNKMKYLDMVVSESLRKWPLANFIDRVCSKDYKLKDDDDNLIFEFKAGDRLWFPVAAFHWDEKYFENPETFDPERFSEANKNDIKPFTYLPFGTGPRNCIGNRYALMQVKAMLYYLVLNYKIERSTKTVKDLMSNIRSFQVNPKDGFWARLVPRQ